MNDVTNVSLLWSLQPVLTVFCCRFMIQLSVSQSLVVRLFLNNNNNRGMLRLRAGVENTEAAAAADAAAATTAGLHSCK